MQQNYNSPRVPEFIEYSEYSESNAEPQYAQIDERGYCEENLDYQEYNF